MPRLLIFLVLLCFAIEVKSQSRIELLGADELTGIERGGVKMLRLIGNVSFKQDQVIMRCDSAYQDNEANTFEAFGRVNINEKDSLILNSRYLRYYGNDKKAFVRDNVNLSDGQMTLTTNQLDYDLKTRVAYYSSGGHVVNQDNVLDSRSGTYNANNKTIGFRHNVVLVNPEYVLKTDTLLYNTISKMAYFYGPTTITSKEGFIYCENGWYHTYTQKARFSKNAYVINEEYRLSADSLIYGGIAGIDTAIGNIQMLDTVNSLVISGQKGVYNRNTSVAIITINPMASVLMEDDSLHITGDTLKSVSDSLNRKSIHAFHHVRFYKENMQGQCDSLHYSQRDSAIYLEVDPILWNDKRQMKADSIRIRLNQGKIEKAEFIDRAIIIEEVDSGLFNQIIGNTLFAWFKENQLNEVLVLGNAENIYFQEEDSIVITSMNYVICTEIRIRFDEEGKAQEIVYIEKPEGTDYPINQLPGEEKMFLKGFHWRQNERPLSKADLFIRR